MQDLKYRFVIEFEAIIPKDNHLNAMASITPDEVTTNALKDGIIPGINKALLDVCKVEKRDLDANPPVVIRICN